MNKSTKIWLNYILGAIISAALLWGIWLQLQRQLSKLDSLNPSELWQTGSLYLLVAVLVLMPVNLLLETRKWHLLVSAAQPIRFKRALASMLAGIAFSLITPNRIGEYPARIIYLRANKTFRLISVSVLGVVAQMLALFIFGLAGLIYYNIHFPGWLALVVLLSCLVFVAGLLVLYFHFGLFVRYLSGISWLRRLRIYGQLLGRFSRRPQLTILGISLARFAVYTAQYLILLRWLNVYIPWYEGFMMSSLFFWVMAVIPTFALAELGERGQVALYLFHHFSENTVGILSATIGLWCINLILPAVAGSILLFRTRILR